MTWELSRGINMPRDAIAKLLNFYKSFDNWLTSVAVGLLLERLLGENKMATTDKKIAEELKAKSSNGKRTSSKESAKQGANRIAEFINDVSDKASDQVADAITAATVQKAMSKLGVGDGPLTQHAIAMFESAFTEVLIQDLPGLTGADGSTFLLKSAVDVDDENLN